MCNTSDYTIRVVLGQQSEKKPYVSYYASKTLNGAQMIYTTTEKELLAVVFDFDKFHLYILGSNVVFTDYKVLKYSSCGINKKGCQDTTHQMDPTASILQYRNSRQKKSREYDCQPIFLA